MSASPLSLLTPLDDDSTNGHRDWPSLSTPESDTDESMNIIDPFNDTNPTLSSEASESVFIAKWALTLTSADLDELKEKCASTYTVEDGHWILKSGYLSFKGHQMSPRQWIWLVHHRTAEHLNRRHLKKLCGVTNCVHPEHYFLGVLCPTCVIAKEAGRERCMPCTTASKRLYKLTQSGFFTILLSNAQKSARTRAAQGRTAAGECTLTVEDLEDMWKQQNGRCDWSNVTMQFDGKAAWLVSLERPDPTSGYHKHTAVLVAHEMNGMITWTRDKLDSIRKLQQAAVDLDDLEKQIEVAKVVPQSVATRGRARRVIQVNGVSVYECTACDKFKEKSAFHTRTDKSHGIVTFCKVCTKASETQRHDSLRGFVMTLVSTARSNSKARSLQKRKLGDTAGEIATITMEDIFNMIKNQKGRCAYSGIPLVFKRNQAWVCSVERKDNNKTYTRENVCLVCWEFNTVKQWSKQKVDFMLMCMEERHLSASAPITVLPARTSANFTDNDGGSNSDNNDGDIDAIDNTDNSEIHDDENTDDSDNRVDRDNGDDCTDTTTEDEPKQPKQKKQKTNKVVIQAIEEAVVAQVEARAYLTDLSIAPAAASVLVLRPSMFDRRAGSASFAVLSASASSSSAVLWTKAEGFCLPGSEESQWCCGCHRNIVHPQSQARCLGCGTWAPGHLPVDTHAVVAQGDRSNEQLLSDSLRTGECNAISMEHGRTGWQCRLIHIAPTKPRGAGSCGKPHAVVGAQCSATNRGDRMWAAHRKQHVVGRNKFDTPCPLSWRRRYYLGQSEDVVQSSWLALTGSQRRSATATSRTHLRTLSDMATSDSDKNKSLLARGGVEIFDAPESAYEAERERRCSNRQSGLPKHFTNPAASAAGFVTAQLV